MFVEERITAFLDQYLKINPCRKASERFVGEIKANAKSFQSLVDNLKYEMKLNITEEGTFVVEFGSTQGQVYTTYTFNNAVVAAQ